VVDACFRRRSAFVAPLLALLVGGLADRPGAGGEVGRALRGLAAPLHHVRQPPAAPGDPCVEDLAARIDWLKRRLETEGSIVAKQPDVWGQNRLTRHRMEYEEEMRRQLGQFAPRSSAALRRSDQAFLGMALAVQSASGRRRTAVDPAATEIPAPSVVNTIQGMIPSTNEAAGRADSLVIARTAPLAFPPAPPGFQFDGEPPALEPTLHLDQLSRYLNHLHQLRRVNEGDDSADAPGYSLNLVRIPVSIQPGARTRRGHGAEITISVEPCLGDDLLPTTVRNLVINDVVDTIAPGLTWCVNDPQCVGWATTIVGADDAAPAPGAVGAGRQGVLAAARSLRAKLPAAVPAAAPAVTSRRARLPLPFTQLADVAGIEQIAVLVRDTHAALAGHPANQPCIGYVDVRGYLAEELRAAWEFLAVEDRRHVWQELPAWNLAALVRGRRTGELTAIRRRFFATIGRGLGAGIETVAEPPLVLPAGEGPPLAADPLAPCGEADHPLPTICRTTTAVLAWAILVESALLDERLAEDMREAAGVRGQGRPAGLCTGPFFGPDPTPQARAAFNDYVRCRWPIRVFALDPLTDEQNVDDSYARRRELQIALATAAATGRLNAQALARYTRRLETDMATVALNRTAVGFAHGSDTFGWRFYPRVQTPPTRGTLATLGETIRGGPTSAGDLAQRSLEPGIRECTAIIVMPSFVPWITFDVRGTWFSLAHPRAAAPGVQETLTLSRAVKGMHDAAAACGRCAHRYRDGEVPRLLKLVEQLDRALPLQTMQAQVPHENTAGGFELFTAGITDLAPELLGWYGGPGIDPAAPTTLFLVGKGFSVHDTAVVAGGQPVRFKPLSREVLQVEVPAGVATLGAGPDGECVATNARGGPLLLAGASEPLPAPVREPAQVHVPADSGGGEPAPACAGCGPLAGVPCVHDCRQREWVDVHLATPFGVSSHLLVPVARRAAARPGGLAFDPPCTLELTFTVTKTTAARTESARIDEFFAADCTALTIAAPEAFVPPAKGSLRLLVRDRRTSAVAATFSVDDPFFDARHSRYSIAGGDLRNFVGDTSRPATDKTLRGALKPYLDTLLQQGGLGADGDAVSLTISAELVAGQQVLPVGGTIAVTATRRGRTAVEPQSDPTATAP
jgi:hypothetical protein